MKRQNPLMFQRKEAIPELGMLQLVSTDRQYAQPAEDGKPDHNVDKGSRVGNV